MHITFYFWTYTKGKIKAETVYKLAYKFKVPGEISLFLLEMEWEKEKL